MINVAIVGCGNIAHSHIEAYLTFSKRCQIKYLIDADPVKASGLKSRYKLDQTIITADYQRVLDDSTVMLISICLPPALHAAMTIAALNAGKDVLCEKPMALSVAECDEMLAAQKQSGKILSIVAQNRFQDRLWKLKQIIDTGLIGKILHVQVDSFWWRGHAYYDKPWRGTWQSEGGGATLSQAVHNIDMLNWFIGLPRYVTAVLANVDHDNAEVEDLSVAVLQYQRGTIATVTSSTVHHGQRRQIIIQGQKAMIAAPWQLIAEAPDADGFPLNGGAREVTSEIGEYYSKLRSLKYTLYDGQIEDVLNAIETNSMPLVTGVEGRQAIALISAIYAAGSRSQTISFPLATTDPFYQQGGRERFAPHFH
ncbi:Gfo/Idh/MocA family protein [Lacticaseibacillus jixiensis]|uniref:Gfo/Idh/MocA family protein n=1 Tax=Lacticaseibacillus jixiensis TaxID=3231926 RepID=UPI0036F397A0